MSGKQEGLSVLLLALKLQLRTDQDMTRSHTTANLGLLRRILSPRERNYCAGGLKLSLSKTVYPRNKHREQLSPFMSGVFCHGMHKFWLMPLRDSLPVQ